MSFRILRARVGNNPDLSDCGISHYPVVVVTYETLEAEWWITIVVALGTELVDHC